MARKDEILYEGTVPHHVTQRGNRRQATFFHEADYIAYLDLMAEWSSAAAHVSGRNDALVEVAPMLRPVDDWREYLSVGLEPEQAALLRRHERTGRPLGSVAFLQRLGNRLDRVLRKKTPGRKPKKKQKYVWCPQKSPIGSGCPGRAPEAAKSGAWCADTEVLGVNTGKPGLDCFREVPVLPELFGYGRPGKQCCYKKNGDFAYPSHDKVNPVSGRNSSTGECKFNDLSAIIKHLIDDKLSYECGKLKKKIDEELERRRRKRSPPTIPLPIRVR